MNITTGDSFLLFHKAQTVLQSVISVTYISWGVWHHFPFNIELITAGIIRDRPFSTPRLFPSEAFRRTLTANVTSSGSAAACNWFSRRTHAPIHAHPSTRTHPRTHPRLRLLFLAHVQTNHLLIRPVFQNGFGLGYFNCILNNSWK